MENKKKMDTNRKTSVITIRVSEGEKSSLMEQSRRSRQTLSAFILSKTGAKKAPKKVTNKSK